MERVTQPSPVNNDHKIVTLPYTSLVGD